MMDGSDLPISQPSNQIEGDRNSSYCQSGSARRISSPLNYRSKPSIIAIGLPKRPDSGQLRRAYRRPGIPRSFPKSSGELVVPLADPGSPKVSCVGRVRIRRRRGSSGPSKSSRVWQRFLKAFGRSRGLANVLNDEPPSQMPANRREAKDAPEDVLLSPAPSLGEMKRLASCRRPEIGRVVEDGPEDVVQSPVPRLGDMKRLASCRRPASWAGDERWNYVSRGLDGS